MMPPCFSFHCQACFKNSSRVSEFLSIPSALSFWTTLASVAIDAWSLNSEKIEKLGWWTAFDLEEGISHTLDTLKKYIRRVNIRHS